MKLQYIDGDTRNAEVLKLLAKNPDGMTRPQVREALGVTSLEASSSVASVMRAPYCVIDVVKVQGQPDVFILREMLFRMSEAKKRGRAHLKKMRSINNFFKLTKRDQLINSVFC